MIQQLPKFEMVACFCNEYTESDISWISTLKGNKAGFAKLSLLFSAKRRHYSETYLEIINTSV